MQGEYKVITLCGSTRFKDAFLEVQKKLTLEGNIVISVGLFGHAGDAEAWEEGTKEALDKMHRAKIDMADEVFIIDVNHYIGLSTRAEIEYAESTNKPIRYLSSSGLGDKHNKKQIQDYPCETFFYDWFHNCKTLDFTSKSNNHKCFVEYVDETDVSENITDPNQYEDLSIRNAVRKLMNANETDFFYEKNDADVYPVIMDAKIYYVKVEDSSKRWSNHYWLRTKRPLIGFKAVKRDGGSVMLKPTDPTIRYEVGKAYTIDEEAMLNNPNSGAFFSLSIDKALNYMERDYRLYLVAASGLIFVKNNWDDMAASSLRIIRDLSTEEIDLIKSNNWNPRGFWNGEMWGSYDDDFEYEILKDRY